MTREELGKGAAAAWAAVRPWLPYVLLVVLLLVWARSCNRGARDAQEVGRLNEAEELRDAGQEVVAPLEDLGPRVAELEARNAELAAELARARAAAPGAKPAGVLHGETTGKASGTPAPTPPPTVEGGKQEPPPPCLLFVGQALKLEVDGVELLTEKGNRLAVGTLAAWRVDGPGLEALLERQPFSRRFTEAAAEPLPANEAARWRAGPLGVVGREGWMLGGLVATPQGRLPLIGSKVEALAGGAMGPGGGAALVSILIQP